MNIKKHILLLILTTLSVAIMPQAGGASGGGSEEHVGPVFVEMKPIIVPVFTKHSRVEVLALNLVLEAPDNEHSALITENTPKLRDGFIRSLYGRLHSDALINKHGVLNVEMLKRRLMVVANHVMEPGTVNDILLQGVVHQKGR